MTLFLISFGSIPWSPNLPLARITYQKRTFLAQNYKHCRGGEWYLEKRGSRKILAGSWNLRGVSDKSRSLVFAWFVFTFFKSRNVLPKSLGLGFLTRISASRWVSDFTIRHPSLFWGKAEKSVLLIQGFWYSAMLRFRIIDLKFVFYA